VYPLQADPFQDFVQSALSVPWTKTSMRLEPHDTTDGYPSWVYPLHVCECKFVPNATNIIKLLIATPFRREYFMAHLL
jgi:hypothetical protein